MTQTEERVETETEAATDDAAALVEFLRERDVACPLCRYNLRGLRAPRCPECGRELRLGVWLAEPRMAAWIVALVPALLAAGVGVLLMIAMLVDGWDVFGGMSLTLMIVLGSFLVFVPIAAAVIALRRRFMRLSQWVQWLLAGLLVLAAGVAFVGYVYASS